MTNPVKVTVEEQAEIYRLLSYRWMEYARRMAYVGSTHYSLDELLEKKIEEDNDLIEVGLPPSTEYGEWTKDKKETKD